MGICKEIGMCVAQNKKTGGYLFIAAGCAFFLAAMLGKQSIFYSLGAMYVAMGAAQIGKAKRM